MIRILSTLWYLKSAGAWTHSGRRRRGVPLVKQKLFNGTSRRQGGWRKIFITSLRSLSGILIAVQLIFSIVWQANLDIPSLASSQAGPANLAEHVAPILISP